MLHTKPYSQNSEVLECLGEFNEGCKAVAHSLLLREAEKT